MQHGVFSKYLKSRSVNRKKHSLIPVFLYSTTCVARQRHMVQVYIYAHIKICIYMARVCLFVYLLVVCLLKSSSPLTSMFSDNDTVSEKVLTVHFCFLFFFLRFFFFFFTDFFPRWIDHFSYYFIFRNYNTASRGPMMQTCASSPSYTSP